VRSISFDRAADYYDATRGLPAEPANQLTDLLAAELEGTYRALEIGVGTGRIALPLHQRGARLVGIDLAAPMLRRLIDNAGGDAPFPVFVADATRLPFTDASYDAVLASHVFHLIPDWQMAVDEALRVLRPGGRLLIDFGGGVDSPWRALMLETFHAHGVERIRPGISEPDGFASYLAGQAIRRPLPTITLSVRRSLGQDLHDLERQIMSWSWDYSPEQMKAAADAARVRAAEDGLDLDEEAELVYRMQWWAFDLAPE
jgi:ubiquinone/menaquinone biosynthesis C-methylase UbiE